MTGLFNPDHMDYELDRISRNPIREPSLAEMTEKAIRLLQRGPNGYFLFVEGKAMVHMQMSMYIYINIYIYNLYIYIYIYK